MRALICASTDEGIDGLRLGNLEPRPLDPGSVRIAVRAAGVNFADTLLVQGRYQERPQPPFAPGLEAAGEIIEVGADVADLAPGQRVVAFLDHGGFGEQAVARASDVTPLPPEVDDETAAGFLITYATAHLALVERARLEAGERLAVFGASGGVGFAAVEVGHALGATVVAVASSTDKLAVAQEHGADHVVSYRTEDVAARLEELVGGPDVVFDPVGGDLFDAAMHTIRPGGRILAIGFASGRVPQVPANHLLVKDAAVLGLSIGQLRAHRPAAVRAAVEDLLGMLERGTLRPLVSKVYDLEHAVDALREVEAGRAVGKLVVRVAGG